MPELYSITIALLLAVIGGQIAKALHYPRIIGQLVMSLFCAVPLLKAQLSTESSMALITTMSQLGIVLLLFITGFDLDLSKMKEAGKDAVLIAIAAAIVPFLAGFGLGMLLEAGVVTAIILGACMAVTAEGTNVALLLEMKKIRTRLGSIMLGAGIADDFFEVFFLMVILILSHKAATENLFLLPVKITLFIAVVLLVSRFLPRFIHRMEAQKDTTSLLTVMCVFALLFAIGSELTGLGSILGAFIAGILMQRSFLTSADRDGEDLLLHSLAFSLIIPFFFVNIGLNFSFSAIIQNPILTLLVFLVAIGGKLAGTLITKPLVSLSWRQLTLVGWGMNSRGVMELVIAQIALTAGLITQELYSAIVFMAIATTLLFPFVLQRMIRKTPDIMN